MIKTNHYLTSFFGTSSRELLLLLMGLLIVVSLYDLFSPPITPTIARQTQTAMLSENFAREGFSLKGLYLNVHGYDKPTLVLEFPFYNFVTGVLFLAFQKTVFWSKLISLIASLVTLGLLFALVKKYYGDPLATATALFFICCPVGLLMRTAVQPDAFGLMFQMLALFCLAEWRDQASGKHFVFFCLSLLVAGLAKFPIIVPYLPIMIAACLIKDGRWRMPQIKEVVAATCLFLVPFVAWYLFRGQLTHPELETPFDIFLLGDMSRFLTLRYYIKPIYTIGAIVCSGIGVLFFIVGLGRLTGQEGLLLAGIPLYFVTVPTVSDQYYYLYVTVPIFAFFMARGFLTIRRRWEKGRAILFYSLIVLFASGCIITSLYVLRHDRVMWAAAEAVKQASRPDDLIFSISLHDRNNIGESMDPSMFYLSQRQGWNAEITSANLQDIVSQVEAAKAKGARWLVITWYGPDLEAWFVPFIPQSLRRDPGVDGRAIFHGLQGYYQTVKESRHFAVMELREKTSRASTG